LIYLFAVLVVMVIIAAAALIVCVTVVCIGCFCLRRWVILTACLTALRFEKNHIYGIFVFCVCMVATHECDWLLHAWIVTKLNDALWIF